MRRLFSIMFSAVLLLIVSGQGTWAQNGEFSGGKGVFAPGTITHSGRTVLQDDIVHYRFDVVVGPGKFDVIRLHRVVKERMPRHPVRTVDGVLLLPGAPNFFEAIFMAPLISSVPAWDRSIVVFLAENNIDVWGMDYGWALVAAETTDFNFMKGWGVAKDAQHAEIALSLARQIRGITDQDFGPLHLLGFSYGTYVAYSVAGEETQWPHFLRNVKGIIPVDCPRRSADASVRAYYCSDIVQYRDMLKAGVYSDDSGLFLKQLSDLALSAPGDPSPNIPGLTNYQAALFLGTSTWLLDGDPIFWHFVAGAGAEFLDPFWIPSDLQYTEARLWLDLLQAVPPHLPVQADVDTDAVDCGNAVLPWFDAHLGEIAVPILYVGARGGTGEYGYYTTSLTASKDVTKFTVSLTGDRPTDFGHADQFLSKDAQALVWQPILNWVKAHR